MQIFGSGIGSGKRSLRAAPAGAARSKFSQKVERLDKIKRNNFVRKRGVRSDFLNKKLPYKNNFLGAIIAVQVISHERIENIRKLIKEMDRILKPNGLIFIAFNQRSKVKNWRVGSIQKERFIGDDGVSMFEESRRILGSRTHVPIEGTEKGLIHYAFDKKAIKKEFKDFKIHRLSLDSKKCRYILLAESKKIK